MMVRRRAAAVAGALLGALLLVLATAIAVVFFFGVSIDASRWRDALAARASTALGRPVRLSGPIELRLGRETALLAHDVRVSESPGSAVPDLATIGATTIRIDTLSVLRGPLHVRGIELAEVLVRFARSVDGRLNWTLPTASADSSGASTATARPPTEIELDRVSIRRLVVEYRDARSEGPRVLEVEELTGAGGWRQPLRLAARIRAPGTAPCSIDLMGAPAAQLGESNRAWPFTLDAECPEGLAHASGVLEAGRNAARFSFGAGTANLDGVGRLLPRELPKLGGAALAGNVVASARAIEVADLNGVLGDTQVAGALTLGLDGARPHLSGELAIATLDLRPFLDGERRSKGEALSNGRSVRQPLPLAGAVPVDADVVLRVARLLGVPGEVSDARLAVHADERTVRAPLAATVAGIGLDGRIELDTAAPTPALALEVGAQDTQLSGRFAEAHGIEGRVGRFALRLHGRGATVDELLRDVDLRLEVAEARLRYGGFAGGRPIEFTLDTLELAAPRGQSVRGTAKGTLLGKSVRLAIRGGKLAQILDELATPIQVELATRGATARLSGTLALASRGTDLSFRLDAPHAGSLAEWLGVAPQAKLPVVLHGRARLEQDNWRLEEATLEVGRSKLTVDARRAVVDGRSVVVVVARSTLIDVPELATLRARPTGAPEERRLATLLDAPILPERIDLADADVSLELARVVLGRAELAEVALAARVRDGRLPPSPWKARVAGALLTGRVALDLRGAEIDASLSLSAQEADIGALLRTLSIAEIIDEHATTFEAELAGRGNSLGELLERSSLKARITGGALTLRGPGSQPAASIRVNDVFVDAPAGEPLTVRIDGALNETPTTITVSGGTFADFARRSEHVPFTVDARVAGASLVLDGQVALPLGRGGKLTLELAGERLDSLRGLARAELPPWGPWSISGPFSVTPTGYAVTQLTVRVGESRLYGRARLEVTGARPHVHASIRAPTVQLDDFPFEARPATERSSSRIENLRATARDAAGQTEELLSRAFLRRFDASLEMDVQQVLSGADRLGYGRMRLELADGRLNVESLEVNLPGGGARMYGSYDTRGREVAVAAAARIERFDYGVLARRNRPGADIQGLLSLDIGIRSAAPSLDSIFAHADGHIDFAVWPKDLRGGVFDRWSVNMFIALMPILDPGTESRVNCFVGRLDLHDGLLTHDALVIDTTRVRALGAGRANFRTEEIAFRFRPRAKGAAFFSLQTPLSITGTMSDFKIAPTRGDFAEAFARLLTSVITLPLETLIHGPLPLDGADVCTDPLRSGVAVGQ